MSPSDDTGGGANNRPYNNESTPLLSNKPSPNDEFEDEFTERKDNIYIPDTPVPDYYQNASPWSKLVFSYLEPLLNLGNEKDQLDPKDIANFPLLPEDSTRFVKSLFYDRWKEEKDGAVNGKKKKPSLARALFHAFGYDFIKAGFLKFIHDCLQFVAPQVLNGLIRFLRNPDAPLSEGILLTLCVSIAQLIMSICLRHYFFVCYRTGLRIRTSIVVAIFDKALVLSSTERQRRSVGEITNLMSVDAQRLQDICTYLHAVWYSVLQIGLAIYFLWGELGPSCLAGVAAILCSIPLTAVVTKWMRILQTRLMKAKDKRVDMNNEVLSSMKVVKLQAWEKSFQDRIESLRKAELKELFRYWLGRCLTFVLWATVPLVVALATFAAYVLSGHRLEVASALTSLVLFDIIRFPLFMFPNVINSMVEAGVAISRLESFLLCEDHIPVSEGDLVTNGVEIECATFVYDSKRSRDDENDANGNAKSEENNKMTEKDTQMVKELSDSKWELRLLKSQLADAENKIKALLKEKEGDMDEEQEESAPDNLLSLRRADFDCSEGQLIAVVGAVGSGKSTLINGILGEIRPISGSVSVKGRIGYFAQTPFIMNDTLKSNIIFGAQNINIGKYKTAIDVCALTHDLETLPGGELCEIGEKGITLSGGQKARVAMARAVYHDADIYLLDDPLAAVDAHVGKHIFEKCIVKELLQGEGSIWSKQQDDDCDQKEKTKKPTVILVTNALQYLSNPAVDKIVVLKDGCVEEVGTYDELTTNPKKSVFKSLLKTFNESMERETENEGADVDAAEEAVPEEEEGEEEGEEVELEGEEEGEEPPIESDIPSFKFPSPLKAGKLGRQKSAPVLPSKRFSPLKNYTRAQSSLSVQSGTKTTIDSKKSGATLMTDELKERETGQVSKEIYFDWARAAGGVWVAFVVIGFYLVVKGVNILSQWWLTYWSQHGGEAGSQSQMWFLAVYAGINSTAIVATFFRMLFGAVCGLRAARVLFSEMLDVTLKTPMSFFDTTPTGRIVNRFSKDIYTVDEVLPFNFQMYLSTIIDVVGAVFVVSSITPFFTLCLFPILFFYYLQQSFFTKTYRELKRLDSVSRSPIYALFSETLDGVSSIRAFEFDSYLSQNKIISMVDAQQNAYFLTCTAQCWLGVRLELAGTFIILFACLCAVLQHGDKGGDETYAGLAGLSISFALTVTQSLNWSVRMASDLEANMVAVERIKQYCKLDTEAPRLVESDGNVDPNWPSKGVIEFRNAKLRYRPGLPLVLKGLNITIPSHSKIGVVGRTGAGKSTLMVALLRIVELDSGCVVIDDVNIKTLGLTKLRSKIAVIPQDPVLFSGTVRTNLDPFNNHSDETLRGALCRVGLMSGTGTTSAGDEDPSTSDHGLRTSAPISTLEDQVLESGSNFSVGQRQLLVFARALLCGSSIVIMDEATAAVDAETDARIQHVVRTEFKDATCITVAHRLNTIMDSDYILVMDDGVAVEFDAPSTLLGKEQGLFKDLVETYEEEHKNES